MKIGKIMSDSGLNENNHGPIEVKFALLNPETGDTITPFCKCKDYFSDVFWGNNTKKPVRTYGFNWDPGQDKGVLDKDSIFVAIKFTSRTNSDDVKPGTKEQVENIKAFLNKFEKPLGFEPSKVEMCDEKIHIIIEFDKKWIQVPYLVSAFFLFIRLGVKYDNHSADPLDFYSNKPTNEWMSPGDGNYFMSAKNKISDLLAGKIDKKQKFSQYTDGYSIHNNSGIASYSAYKID